MIEHLRFKILSRQEAESFHYVAREPYVMISIAELLRFHAQLEPDPNRLGVLKVQFDDIQKPLKGHDLILFTKKHAQVILDFVEKYRKQGVRLIVVHCGAGASRSPAVGLALCEIYNGLIAAERMLERNLGGYFNQRIYKEIIKTYKGGKLCVQN